MKSPWKCSPLESTYFLLSFTALLHNEKGGNPNFCLLREINFSTSSLTTCRSVAALTKSNKVDINYSLVSHVVAALLMFLSPPGLFIPQSEECWWCRTEGSEYKHPLKALTPCGRMNFTSCREHLTRLFIYSFFRFGKSHKAQIHQPVDA